MSTGYDQKHCFLWIHNCLKNSLISPRFDLRNGMIAEDDSFHLVTQIIDIRGFFLLQHFGTFQPLGLNVV